MAILSIFIYRFHTIPIKFHQAVFTEAEKNTPKIYMEPQKIPNSQINPRKE